jgi:hypothetical protein
MNLEKKSFISSSDLRHEDVVERVGMCSTRKVCIDIIRETGNFAFFDPVWAVQNYTNIINEHDTDCVLTSAEYIFFS